MALPRRPKKEYWVCIIGGVDLRDDKRSGLDNRLRSPVEKAFRKTFGRDAEICASGFGVTEKTKKKLLKVWDKNTWKE